MNTIQRFVLDAPFLTSTGRFATKADIEDRKKFPVENIYMVRGRVTSRFAMSIGAESIIDALSKP